MWRPTFAAFLVALLLAAACTSTTEATVDETWAAEAENVVALLADAYDIADPYQTARFFTAGGTLDLTIWGYGVLTTPDEVVEAVRTLWFMEPGFANVRADHTFVSPENALVWWSAYDKDFGGGNNWVQSYSFGPRGRTASKAFRNVESPDEYVATPEELAALESGEEINTREELAALELADRYAAAWELKDTTALTAVYDPAVVVRDDTTGEQWSGVEELLADLGNAPSLEPGPHPRTFVHQAGNHVEMVVLVQLGGDCPRLEARRLLLAGDSINRETRFTHVPSAQRCLTDLPDGWWSTFELPPDLQNNVTAILDIGGSQVQLVNAEPVHEEFTSWLFDRYIEAEIGIPEVAAVWYPPAPECDKLGGLAIESDDRYQGRHTVVICFTADRLEYPDSKSGWFPSAAAYGLHELGHIWMVDHLTDDIRAEFNDRAGLAEWRSADAKWAERGVEWAAFTIPWAITGVEDAVWPIYFEKATCEELADRYRLLTNHEPLTPCGEEGWS
ncbi:MAG: hypothetical protein QNJ89_09160 [Acidimicrobiia bacterium]|nr:hypothetical protein [Acidimicrobiia bacterium]